MTAADPSYSRRWLNLAVVGVAQVVVVLDTTVINIAKADAPDRPDRFHAKDRCTQ
jgi:hypothetical protein